ncbi:transcriptional regulator family: Fungal Specific TF [Penicillium cataractarum]|uniref:Transcriptional regulator family: Fungal Specific TF n=1 Tax=Penicillium cataractarum TaxID=2100454 RepID=A0A9W9VWU9_9EURO|nr:transcriptional regulator family: Fungal Specific TF [Penicillium cataractarum]KAJ5390842.1 transcriptional regulator family: Fungal Specific TF [Penicillium cataractarum]
MASPSSVSTRLEENESDWQYGLRSAKRRRRASTAGASRPSPREIGFMREPQSEGSASFLGSSSGIHFIRHVYNAFARRSADLQQNRTRDKSSVPGEDDRLRRGGESAHEVDAFWLPEELNFAPTALFTFEDLVNWTRRYFENWHPCFPCLHAPTVLQAMERLARQGPEAISRLDLIIIRSLISISLGDERQAKSTVSEKEPIPAVLVFQNVQHVMQEIQSLLAEPTTLPLLQAAFTAQLALTSLLRLNAASRVGGVITRTAFHLGLHRCPGRFSCFSNEEIGIRRRLFWSIYSLERYLSQALGIPLGIRDDDIDVCYPDAERHVTPNPTTPNDPRLRLLCHLAKFARIRGLILELRNKSILHSHAGALEASHVNGELSQWWNEVYDDVNPIEDSADPESEASATLTPYHRLLLMILRHEAIIAMNRPLLAAEKPNPDYKHALQTCIASSRSLLAALRKYMSSESYVPLTWPSFTWTTWMACLILMYASWEGELPVSTALKYAKMAVHVLENLALRGSSWPETCIEAIKSMESALSTNIPGNNPQAIPAGPPGSAGGANINQVSQERSTPTGENGLLDRNQRRLSSRVNPTSVPYDHYDSTIFSTPRNPGNDINDPSNDEQMLNAQNSAGLIFGNLVNNTAPFYPGIAGQDPLPFSDPSSLFMNDLWSVADGPWMIHGNFL